jgi:hypothetical protein
MRLIPHNLTSTSVRASVASAIVCGVAAVAASSGAVSTAAAASCPPPPTPVQPFTAWGDSNSYVMTTGGTFEANTPAWTPSGGAAVVSGNAPDRFAATSDSHSLYLPSGSSATSVCVTAPHIVGIVRFWARSVGAAGGQLKVEVLVKGGVYQAGTITAGTSWSPSPMLSSNAPNYSGAVTYQVRLTPVGAGSAFVVDDLYFDPYCSR